MTASKAAPLIIKVDSVDSTTSFTPSTRSTSSGKRDNDRPSMLASASQTNPKLVFRIYKTDEDSFMDFARLISRNYKSAASVSNDSTQYAKAIAYSPYISEQNGDNRPAYQKAVLSNSNYIDSMSELVNPSYTVKVIVRATPSCTRLRFE